MTVAIDGISNAFIVLVNKLSCDPLISDASQNATCRYQSNVKHFLASNRKLIPKVSDEEKLSAHYQHTCGAPGRCHTNGRMNAMLWDVIKAEKRSAYDQHTMSECHAIECLGCTKKLSAYYRHTMGECHAVGCSQCKKAIGTQSAYYQHTCTGAITLSG